MKSIFHFAFNVNDLALAKKFYGEILQCKEGRSTESWVDFDFYGHQISLHLGEPFQSKLSGEVGNQRVPMPHFGLILELTEWNQLAQRLIDADVEFVLPPSVRFEGEPGEQKTMFFRDPSGNPIEMKSFDDEERIYAQ